MTPRATSAAERARLAALSDLDVLDTPPDPALDELVRLAARLLDVPLALVNLVGEDRQWAKAAYGAPHGLEVAREDSLCAWAIAEDAPLVVPDARADPRFAGTALVREGLRFYAGVPLRTAQDQAVGTLCVGDRRPRVPSPEELDALGVLARAVVAHVQLRRENRRLADLSATDDLTGTANRRAFDAALGREVDRALRTRLPLSLLLVDLDDFKRFNDARGHPAGDALLRAATGRWLAELRTTDTLARFGGDEFAVLLPATALGSATRVAERLRGRVPDGASCSIGAAELLADEPADGLVARADAALYAAKRGGRDRVRAATASLLA